jgi:hypothetical protein
VFSTAVVFSLVALAGTALASSVQKLSLAELTRGAALVVEVEALSADVVRERSRIPLWTETRLRVTKTLKGAAGAEIVLRHPGGRTPTTTIVADGFPSVPVGSKALLFLTPLPKAGTYRVYGLEQGAYFIDGEGALAKVTRADALAVDHEPRVTAEVKPPVSRGKTTLAALRAEILRALEGSTR